MKLHTALTIAGTDPSGGAGIMADLKSFQSRHVYGMAVVTSVVAQNTTGVHHVEHLSLEALNNNYTMCILTLNLKPLRRA